MRRLALALVALSPGVRCAAGASSSTAQWYIEEYEYNFVEMLMLMVLVVLAIGFEATWHHTTHKTVHSYKFGRIENFINTSGNSAPFGTVKNQQLFRELVNRAGGEFMTLGFLAAVVYFFRQGGGFDWLAEESAKDYWPYPQTADQWLHMAENVHLKLFFAMVFYFILTARLVSGAVYRIRLWEHTRLKRIVNNFDDMPSVEHLSVSDAIAIEHAALRRYFMFKMVRWQRKRPKVFRRLIHELQLSADDEDFDERFYELMDNDFSFSAYLAVSIESGVRDSIQVHVATWFVLLVAFAVFAALHRTAHMDLLQIMPGLIILLVLCIVVMRLLIRRTRKQIADRMAQEEAQGGSRTSISSLGSLVATTTSYGRSGDAFHCLRQLRRWLREAHRTEFFVMRLLQVVLFLISYLFSRILLDFQDWRLNTDMSLLYTGLFCLLFIALAIEVPQSVPLFLGITSLPPYMDYEQFRLFAAVLLQGREATYQKEMAEMKAKLLHGGTGELDEEENEGEGLGDMRILDASDDFADFRPESEENTPLGNINIADMNQAVSVMQSHSSNKSLVSRRPSKSKPDTLLDQQGEFFRTFIALAHQRGLSNDEVAKGINLCLGRPVPLNSEEVSRPGTYRPSSAPVSPHAGVDNGPRSPSVSPAPSEGGGGSQAGSRRSSKSKAPGGGGGQMETPETSSTSAPPAPKSAREGKAPPLPAKVLWAEEMEDAV